MNILLVRHGETAWNALGRFQGRTDVPLSPEGKRQAFELSQRLRDLPLTRVVASPLIRAHETAEIVARVHQLPVATDDRLIEISHGDWEGKFADDAWRTDPEILERYRTNPGRDDPAGPKAETLGSVFHRSWAGFEDATHGLGADDCVLIAAHDAVNRAILCQVLGLSTERVWSFRQAPATLNYLAGTSLQTLQVVRLNDYSHVSPLFADPVHVAL